MKADVILRPFTPLDADRVVDLLQDVSDYRPELANVFELARVFSEQKESYACIAVQGERLVGFGSLFVLIRVRGGRSAVIEDMVVAADMRDQGIGRLMLKDLLAQARARGCFKVVLESSEMGREFYLAAGFKTGGQIMKYFL